MDKLKGTRTEANLQTAFAGESQVRGKYHYFAAVAREEGYDAVARYFEESAVNEQEHAKIWFKHLSGIGTTKENLQAAIDGESAEYTEMYPDFAKVAKEEGFEDIAKQFEQIGNIEKAHADHFKSLLEKLDSTKKVMVDRWKCVNCGNIVTAKEPPNVCPVCAHADIPWSGSKAYKQMSD
jgi:rubrerythrin